MIECEPVDRSGTARLTQPEPSSVTVPRGAEPSKKVTEPLGVPAALTVATNVTCCPNTAEPTEALSAIVAAARPIAKLIGVDWLEA